MFFKCVYENSDFKIATEGGSTEGLQKKQNQIYKSKPHSTRLVFAFSGIARNQAVFACLSRPLVVPFSSFSQQEVLTGHLAP